MCDLVSIITPCYNSGLELLNTIESVQKQTYRNYEHIIIDDCSSKTIPQKVLEVISEDPKIILIRRRWNGGPAVTRNRGISAAKGRYIAFLDADDIWHPEKLERQVGFMVSSGSALTYTSYDVINTRGKILGTRIPPVELNYEDILKSNQIGCLTAMYDVLILGKVYMPNIAKRQDMGLWLRILKKVEKAKGIVDKPLARYRVGTTSVSSNKMSVLKYQWRLYREVEQLSFRKSLVCFSHYAFRGINRKV